MWRLLIRVFPLSLFSFVAAVLIVLHLMSSLFSEQIENISISQTKVQIFLLKEHLRQSTSEEDWLQKVSYLQKEYPGTIKVIPFSALPDKITEKKRRQLLSGQEIAVLRVICLGVNASYYIYDKQYDKLLFIDSNYENSDFQSLDLLAYLLIFGMGLFFVSLWLSFHWFELKKLMYATDQISKGNFSFRAKLNKLSSVQLMAEKINQMASYIERLVNGQRDLIHSVSHELRTPISRLGFGLELLKKMSQDPDEIQEVLIRIEDLEEDVKELSDLVNELLQLATAGQQYQLEIKFFNISELLQASLRVLNYPNQQKEIITKIPKNINGYKGDARLLERAIVNILCNADKYAKNKICISIKQQADSCLEIIIEDDGPGLPKEEFTRIFEPFYRLQNTWDKKISGYGLGLSITQKIAQVHRGSVTVEHSNLGGAKFIIQLPL